MSLNFERLGTGPPLVMVDGLWANLRTWQPVLTALRGSRELVLIDLPGHGKSAPLAGRQTFEAYADALAGFVRSQGLDTADLVGSSVGGRIVLELTRRGIGRHCVALNPSGFWRGWETRWFHSTLAASIRLAARKPNGCSWPQADIPERGENSAPRSRATIMPMFATDEQIRDAISELLQARKPLATICASEAARALAPDAWRSLMPQVRAAAIAMATEGILDIRQGGRTVAPHVPLRGPIRLGRMIPDTAEHPTTPDGRYFVVRGRLWRKANPLLPAEVREALVKQLMDARRALRRTSSEAERCAGREQVDLAKRALGEQGPVWWTDGEPDLNRKLAKNTPYRDWFTRLSA